MSHLSDAQPNTDLFLLNMNNFVNGLESGIYQCVSVINRKNQ